MLDKYLKWRIGSIPAEEVYSRFKFVSDFRMRLIHIPFRKILYHFKAKPFLLEVKQ